MTSCKSAISLIGNLWEQYGKISSSLGCGVAGVLTTPATTIACLQGINKGEEALKEAIETYEDVVGRTSSLTIGPRLLRLNTWEKGKIFGTFERLFVTAAPMLEDTVSITIQELSGKGKVGIAVCAVAHNGKETQFIDRTLNMRQGGKDKTDQQIHQTLKGVKGKWIVVHLDGKSVANTFQYKLFLDAK